MRHVLRGMGITACTTSLLLVAAAAGTPEDKTAFLRRDGAMKELGRSFTIGIGRVASGRTQFSPDTVAAAENVIRIVATFPTLFPAGSDVEDSHLKPELAANRGRAEELIAIAQADAAALLPVVKTGDKDRIAAAFKTLNEACNACHNEFRKPYE